MENVDLAHLVYLIVLGGAIIGWFIAENRTSLGKTARMALAWILIFFGFLAAYGLWEDIKTDIAPRQAIVTEGQEIVVPRKGDGHFHVTLELNGTPIDFLIDTGATDIVLSQSDAERVGIDPDQLAFIGTARTANGTVRTARAFINEVALGPLQFENVRVSINEGEMFGSLLGMSFLDRVGRIEIEDGEMRLIP